MSVPIWKIKRELARPLRQLKQLPQRISTFLLARHYYDWFLAKKLRTYDGGIVTNQKFAIYLIFPNKGLLRSHLAALKSLIDNNYSPIVVSNLPLNDEDKAALLQNCSLLIERPNFGYDFGGYRDGILELLKRSNKIERLVLLNDSTWFPLPGSKNWLKAAEALDIDFIGAASHYGFGRADIEKYTKLLWKHSTQNRNFHYCSFALMISGTIVNVPEFKAFWKKFPLTNNKTVTVRRGEIGLTQWVIQKGYSHASTLDLSHLDEELDSNSQSNVNSIFDNTMIPGCIHSRALKQSLQSQATSTIERKKFILNSIARQGVSYTNPRYLFEEKDFAFLKKSLLWLDQESSDLTLEFLTDLSQKSADSLSETIKKEALELRASRGNFPETYGLR